MADEAAATGHSKLLALQLKQEGVLADMQAAQRDQERWRAQWEAEKQALQQEHDTLQHSIQVSLLTAYTYIQPNISTKGLFRGRYLAC